MRTEPSDTDAAVAHDADAPAKLDAETFAREAAMLE